MKNLATFKTSDFSIEGNEFETRKSKLGYVSKYDKKFKAPKQIIIENVGTFTFKTSWNADITGIKYIYDSEIFASANDNHAMRVIFW